MLHSVSYNNALLDNTIKLVIFIIKSFLFIIPRKGCDIIKLLLFLTLLLLAGCEDEGIKEVKIKKVNTEIKKVLEPINGIDQLQDITYIEDDFMVYITMN